MLAPNTQLQQRYVIQRILGRGGMGAVYEARDERLRGALVAIKQTYYSESEVALREQFEREATIIAGLRHRALPRVSDHFSENGDQFLVMDYIPGDDLASLQERRGAPFTTEEVSEWIEALLDALDYLHTQPVPIIHRDIKPSNLKLTPRGEIILLDFGLAKNATTPTRQGGSLHAFTKEYAPPEQISGTGTDGRSDLYSLGATLYHLLTGQCPIDATVRQQVVKYKAPDPLQPAHEANPQIPQAISDVLMKAMQPDRALRFQSASEMRTAWRMALRPVAPSPKPQPELPRTIVDPPKQQPIPPTVPVPAPLTDEARTSSRRPLLIAAGALLGLGLGGYVLFGTQLLSSNPSEPQKQVSNPPATVTPPVVTTTATPPKLVPLEMFRYFVELKDAPDSASRNVTGQEAIAATQVFRLHFSPRNNTWLYLIGRLGNNPPATFAIRQVKGGTEFTYPSDGGLLKISEQATSAAFTVVAAAQPVTTLSSLRENENLSEEEKKLVQNLRDQSAEIKRQINRDSVSIIAPSPATFDVTLNRR